LTYFFHWLRRTLSWIRSHAPPRSESTVQAGFNVGAAFHWTWAHSRVTWRAAHLLHVSPVPFWARLTAAAPLSSDVADPAAFLSLVQSQRHVSRRGISEGRHVTIVEEEGERPVDVGSRHDVAGALGKGGVGRGADRSGEMLRAGCQRGRHRKNRQPPNLVERAVHRRRRPRPGQQLDQPVGEASNESTKVGRGRVI
jgi:hypothetical protein